MSQVLDFVGKVHGKQLEVVGKGHEGLLKAAERVGALQGKVQAKLPGSQLTSGINEKVASVLGTPADFLRHGAQSTADWAKLNQEFQNKLAAVLDRKPAAAEESEEA